MTMSADETAQAQQETIGEILAGLREVREYQRETAQQMKETDRRMQETDRQVKETARQVKETDRQMKESDRRLRKAEHEFTTKWGKLLESLVEGDLVPILRRWGILVERTFERGKHQRRGHHFEVDIVAANGEEVVVVEVKTTLRPKDVKRFLAKLQEFQEWAPEYRRHKVYGAVAYLQVNSGAERMAERRGLFVIRATGSSASIVNAEGFRPRTFRLKQPLAS